MENYVSAYDTYTIRGIPDGAICNPGLSAIDAPASAKKDPPRARPPEWRRPPAKTGSC